MRILLAFLLLSLAVPAHGIIVTTEEQGQVEFLAGTQIYTTLLADTYGPNWEHAEQPQARELNHLVLSPVRRVVDATLPIAATASAISMHQEVQREDASTLRAQYRFTLNQDTQFQGLALSFYLPCTSYAGQPLTVYDAAGAVTQRVVLPGRFGATSFFWQDGAERISIGSGALSYTILPHPAVAVALQDNRAWGGADYQLRLYLLGSATAPVSAGTEVSQSLTIQLPQPVDFQLDPSSASSRTDTTGWFPYAMPWDAAPLDLSSLNEKPAGRHGFLQVRNGAFAFADGTPIRFWGVGNTAAANFPTHDQSAKIAARMAKFGINLVRIHQADAGWKEPNLFDESYGDTQHFDPVALDNLDFFLAQLKQQGIYIYLDQLVSRRFTAGDGVVNADQIGDMAKAYAIFEPTLLALQKTYSHDLWTHVNAYTGLAYRDDPAIVLMEFANENDLITFDVTVEPYATNLERMWSQWAAAHGADPKQPVRTAAQRSPDVLRFLDEVQRDYYAEMHHYLRSIGVRVPITGNTWLISPANLPSQATMDYMDSHAYSDYPDANYSHFANQLMVRADPTMTTNSFSGLAPSRVAGKPFLVSEWGQPWPNEWRAELPLALAAVGSFQRWDGLVGYTYRHTAETPVDTISGIFETFNDPAVFGLYPAAALLFRRGDMADAGPPTAVVWTEADLFTKGPRFWDMGGAAYRSLVERVPVVTALSTPSHVRRVISPDTSAGTQGPTWVESVNGQLFRDWRLGLGRINTSRTQAVYGLLGSAPPQRLADVSFRITTSFATVAVSSLDGKVIRESRRLLVTAVGRAENTRMEYNLTHTELQERGVAPILVEPVVGQVTIRNRWRRACVYGLDPGGGRRLLRVHRLAAGQPLTLDLGPQARTIYYLIVLS